MQKTRISALVWAALIAAPIGWSLSRLVYGGTSLLPPVPVILPVFLVILAAMLFAGARAVHGWIKERRHDRHLGPLRVARVLVLAKATEFFGAALAGAYAGLAILAVDHLAAPMGRQALVMSAFVVVTAALATTAAVVLERACLVPPEDEEEPER